MKNHNIKRDNFVAPDLPSPRVEILPPMTLPPAPISEPLPHASYKDKAHGFVLVTAPLAAATGLVVLLIGVTAIGIPLLSVTALLTALAGFSVTWLIALIAYQMISAEGALLIHVISAWSYLKTEQTERIKRYGIKK